MLWFSLWSFTSANIFATTAVAKPTVEHSKKAEFFIIYYIQGGSFHLKSLCFIIVSESLEYTWITFPSSSVSLLEWQFPV